jgi:predicted nuclease of predicted toxin-antitoxin system
VGGSAGPSAAATTEILNAVLLDEMYPPALAKRLRDSGHDVLAVLDVEVGLASRSDDDVLAWAARNSRCVVTENVSDFARLASQGVAHCGLVFVRAQRFPRTASGLVRLGDALDAMLSSNRLPGRDGVAWLASDQ